MSAKNISYKMHHNPYQFINIQRAKKDSLECALLFIKVNPLKLFCYFRHEVQPASMQRKLFTVSSRYMVNATDVSISCPAFNNLTRTQNLNLQFANNAIN